jgi:cell wall-associated NlpC family hydrolase
MALDGIAAIQARIQAIEQQVSAISSPGPAATAASGATTGADFASLLTDAMGTQAASGLGDLGGSGTAGASGATGASATNLSSLLSEASALSGANAPGATGTTSTNSAALSSLVSSLTGGGAATATPDISSLLAGLTGTGGASPAPAVGGSNATTMQFLTNALDQKGKPYVWGASAAPTDPNPAAFDCSELTKWAAARSGVTIPDGAAHQYVWLKQQGATMTVQQALRTPGALLFSFASEPQPGLSGEPAHAHVAISLGNGLTIEAKGHAYGVGVFEAGNRFNYAGMIPGMT